jgi:hypothetical protein
MNHIVKDISWLKNRIKFKYQESNDSKMLSIVEKLNNTLDKFIDINIDEKNIDKIITKYMLGFDTIKDPSDSFSYGYTEQERLETRNNIKNITSDLIMFIINDVYCKDALDSLPEFDIDHV